MGLRCFASCAGAAGLIVIVGGNLQKLYAKSFARMEKRGSAVDLKGSAQHSIIGPPHSIGAGPIRWPNIN